MSVSESEAWGERLLSLGLAVQTQVVSLMRNAFRSGTSPLAEPVDDTGGDRIYRIDQEVETTIESVIGTWPDEYLPLLLIAEGMGNDGRMLFGPKEQKLKYRLIIDPIDGTRMLMYDKRSAWLLAAVCPDGGEDTTLADSIASVMVELPTSKQNLADAFIAATSQQTRAYRFHVTDSEIPHIRDGEEFSVTPSRRRTMHDGFGTVLSMFPGTRRLAADLAERIAESCGAMTSLPTVFDDHYISSGGLIYQLMTGRDLYCLDLRPQFNQILGRSREEHFIESHPYDLAGLLAARNAGVIMTDGFGRPLNTTLDVHSGVDWCGYANNDIRKLIEPVVREWLREHDIYSE